MKYFVCYMVNRRERPLFPTPYFSPWLCENIIIDTHPLEWLKQYDQNMVKIISWQEVK